MSDQIKSSLDSIPLIERVTNLRSALLILVLMLWVDLSLVVVTKTNLLTHPWQESKQQIHYGWVAVLSGAFLAWYVLLTPVVNFFIHACIRFIFQTPLGKIISFLATTFGKEDDHIKEGQIRAHSLKRWGINNADELAIRLATEQLEKNKEAEQSMANINHVAAAFMVLILAEAVWPGSIFQMFVLPLVHSDGSLSYLVKGAITVILIVVATSWWITRPFQWTDSYVYYPKAVNDDSRRRP